ncbi:IS66 family insertion sequence element accessory protein TnpB [Bacteroides sp. An19]|uniref:IS66 family insertion sequence element accessory protein TnpB n=1 Tax=Bacteroides sp. An19 TaxID=1965580 RepID=UPI000B3A7DAA|nr:IS66 family insertion sequence element accessory protein TnpB [Bacteroides sp. An19]OUP35609.1 hypothetical protein B5F25_04165 [Bacteroides sp. An19]
MFSLTGAVKYRYIPGYRDMRGGYEKLCGVVRSLGADPEDGSAYVFTSSNHKLVKIIRCEQGQQQLYVQRFSDCQSFVRLEFDDIRPIYVLEWKYLVALLSCPVVKKIGGLSVYCPDDPSSEGSVS